MNILIGLGLPWTISTCYGMPIVVPDEPELATMVYLEVVCVLTYVVVVMAPTVFTWGRFGRALRRHGGSSAILRRLRRPGSRRCAPTLAPVGRLLEALRG